MRFLPVLLVCTLWLASPAVIAAQTTLQTRESLLERAQVRTIVDTPSMDLKRGPDDPGAFPVGAVVTCDYLDKEMDGLSPKFACLIAPDDEVKVKFGGANGEVQGEVATTRLLWALGFGADRMYPVRVICRGCPETHGTPGESPGERIVDPAVIERKLPGRDMASPGKPGWSWLELDLIDEASGGASRAERDALRLLAVFLQHSDNKPQQQRLVCLDNPEGEVTEPCAQPFMMLNDVGLTFGRANLRNANAISSVNLNAWADTPVWRDEAGCVGNLPRSFTGTLKDPLISEEGRRLLAGLLLQVTDAQLRDLFEVARVNLRPRSPEVRPSSVATVDEWVDAFKQKRDEIVNRRCLSAWTAPVPILFDTAPIRWVQAWMSPALTRVMDAISLLGFTSFYMALAVVIAFSYRLHQGAALLVLLALTAAMADATKAVVTLPRPSAVDEAVVTPGSFLPAVETADAYGFPSGHVAAAAAFLMGLALLLGWRRAWLAALIWVPLIALSRLYLGRHFVADLLGGVAVAVIACAVVVIALTFSRLDTATRQWSAVGRAIGMALAVAAMSLVLGFPATTESGRLLGAALGLAAVVALGDTELPSMRRQGMRIVLAMIVFPLAWWVGSLGVAMFDVDETRLVTLAAATGAMALLLAGPLMLERLLLRTEWLRPQQRRT
jgi:membrane-associated phospholipid phosphatase